MEHRAHFLVISRIRHSHTVYLVRKLREGLIRSYPGRIKIPGIAEPYVTLIPPFLAKIDQARFFNFGVQVVAKIHEHGHNGMLARVGEVGFFENMDEDALFYRITYPEQFRVMVDTLREEIGTIAEWAYELKGATFTPHMTVCTGSGIKKLLEKEILLHSERAGYPIDEQISTPELYMRIPGGSWAPFTRHIAA